MTHSILPTFLIIGGQKCGTTALVHSLRRHPDVFVPKAKEAHHFGSVNASMVGGPAYSAFFKDWQGQPHIGEATPNYLSLPAAPKQIQRVLPSVRLIVSLRHPVERAYSAYWHALREGGVKGSFAEAIAQQSRRYARGEAWAGIVQDGRYLRYLQAYEQCFGRDRIHIILHEELLANPQRIMDGLAAFIGLGRPALDPAPPKNTARRTWLPWLVRQQAARHFRRWQDRTLTPFTPPPMSSMIRSALVEFYRRDNEELAVWLGCDLSAWSH